VYQFKWHYYKKLTIHKYVNLLASFGVTPSETTQAAFRNTPHEEDDSANFEAGDDNPDRGVEFEGSEEDDAIEKAAARIAGLTMDDEENSFEDEAEVASSVTSMKTPPPVPRCRAVGS
jgi:hypothetical protein